MKKFFYSQTIKFDWFNFYLSFCQLSHNELNLLKQILAMLFLFILFILLIYSYEKDTLFV